MSGLFLGIDTSCYTTSVACVNEGGIVSDKRTVLSVGLGERGLRQSDGVFQHTRNLYELIESTLSPLDRRDIAAVGVSVRPRPDEDSYMPVFLSGKTAALAIASALDIPLIPFSHQEGHVRAALMGNEALMGTRFTAMHISGGTTETVTVDENMRLTLIGGSSDLHAGQFVDRIGVSLGLSFPCGQELEKLASAFTGGLRIKLPARVEGLSCSFSGVESAAQRLIKDGADRNELAYAAYDVMARILFKLLMNTREANGCDTALIAGGVASSRLLRKLLAERKEKENEKERREAMTLRFGESALSSDNAVGIALLAMDAFRREKQ